MIVLAASRVERGVRLLPILPVFLAGLADAQTCRLRAAPFVETERGSRTLDLKLGERARVFAAQLVFLDGRPVILGDSGPASHAARGVRFA